MPVSAAAARARRRAAVEAEALLSEEAVSQAQVARWLAAQTPTESQRPPASQRMEELRLRILAKQAAA